MDCGMRRGSFLRAGDQSDEIRSRDGEGDRIPIRVRGRDCLIRRRPVRDRHV